MIGLILDGFSAVGFVQNLHDCERGVLTSRLIASDVACDT